nr:restriction endonuclease fold toxin-2 domain-containing protein [Streptomyces sp. SID14478]
MSTLHQHDFGNRRTEADPANRYQADTAGYPEYDLVLPHRRGLKDGQQADGLRPADGYALDAKYVNEPNTCKSPRTLEKLELPEKDKKAWVAGPHKGDDAEIRDYGRAINDPNGHLKGLEVITNGPETEAYWQYLMAKHGVPGNVRYHPATD